MNGDFTAREWQNGELCTAHGLPYCTPCFKMLVSERYPLLKAELSKTNEMFERMRQTIRQRIESGEFHRPIKRNFFADSRRIQFAATCQVGDQHVIFLPLQFGIVVDDNTAHKASDDELRDILRNEHMWDISTPEWAQYDTPALNDEDTVLLREFQLFKS